MSKLTELNEEALRKLKVSDSLELPSMLKGLSAENTVGVVRKIEKDKMWFSLYWYTLPVGTVRVTLADPLVVEVIE